MTKHALMIETCMLMLPCIKSSYTPVNVANVAIPTWQSVHRS